MPQSIFNSSKEVTVDGITYKLEADVTTDGTEFFKVTNLESGDVEYCTRDGNIAKIGGSDMRARMFPDNMRKALEAAEEVEVGLNQI